MTSELREGDKVDDPLLANPVTQAQPASKAVVSVVLPHPHPHRLLRYSSC